MDFPKRIYTEEEVNKARELVEKGYKHILISEGSPAFKQKVGRVLELVKAAGYFDFLRTYIREIKEIDGLTQLRLTLQYGPTCTQWRIPLTRPVSLCRRPTA